MILPEIYSPTQVSNALDELAKLQAQESGPASQAGRNPFEGTKTGRIYALTDKSRVFDDFPIHPIVSALNDYFLQPNYLLSTFQTVIINPGEKEQAIHTDDGLVPIPRPRPLLGIVSRLPYVTTFIALEISQHIREAKHMIYREPWWLSTPSRPPMVQL